MRTAFRLAALAAAAFAAAPGEAALPPQHQRMAELRAVLEHQSVTAAFGSTPIERVEYVRRDLYRVSAGRCHAARIVDLPMPRNVAGPRRFEVRIGERICAG
jgi:cytochrome c5